MNENNNRVVTDYGIFDSPIKTPNSDPGSRNEDSHSLHSNEELERHLNGAAGMSLLGQETVFSTNSVDSLDFLEGGGGGVSGSGIGGRLHNNDDVTSWATEIRSALHQLITNHSLQGESPDVFALTSAIVGALECLQMQQNQLEEAKIEQKSVLNQLAREKNSREEFELRSAELEDDIEDIKRKHREATEKTRNEKRKSDLELINVKDTVSRLEVQKNEVEKEVEQLRDKYTKLMQRYLDDLNRLKAQQSMERDSISERDFKMIDRIRRATRNGPYDSYNYYSQNEEEDDLNEQEQAKINQRLSLNAAETKQKAMSARVGSTISIGSISSEVFQEGSSLRTEFDEQKVTSDRNTISRNNNSNSVSSDHNKAAAGQQPSLSQEITPCSSPKVELKRGSFEAVSNNIPSLDVASSSTEMQLEAGLAVPVAEIGQEQLSDVRCGSRTLSVQSFETNNDNFMAELQQINKNNHLFLTPSNASQDILDCVVVDNLFGMNEEVQQLLEENSQLQATKNALNVVKDDLIAKVDQMTNEQEFLKEELDTLAKSKDELQERVHNLETEAKRLHSELEKATSEASRCKNDTTMTWAEEMNGSMLNSSTGEGHGSGFGPSDKKFTKREVSTLLMERNMYKERYLELQETVRWMGIMQAERSRHDLNPNNSSTPGGDQRKGPNSSTGIWKLFSGIFGSSPSSNATPQATKRSATSGGHPLTSSILDFTENENHPTVYVPVKANKAHNNEKLIQNQKADKLRRRARTTMSNDMSGVNKPSAIEGVMNKPIAVDGRDEIYGWSVNTTTLTPPTAFSSKKHLQLTSSRSSSTSRRSGTVNSATSQSNPNSPDKRDNQTHDSYLAKYLPIPSYSRPLMETDPTFKNLTLQCACSVMLSGGQYSDSNITKAASSFSSHSISQLGSSTESELKRTPLSLTNSTPLNCSELVSENMGSGVGNCTIVWLCSSSATCSRVSLFDLTSPAESLTYLTFPHSQILTMCSVPGYTSSTREVECGEEAVKSSGGAFGVDKPAERSGETVEDKSISSSSAVVNQTSTILDFGKLSNCVSTNQGNGSGAGVSSSTANSTTTSAHNHEGIVLEMNEVESHLEDIANDVLNSSSSPNNYLPSSSFENNNNHLPKNYWPPNVSDEKELSSASSNPTIWIGCENGNLFVHSAITNWNKCLHSVRLPSSINTIECIDNRMFVGLSGGSIAVFYRDAKNDNLWDLKNYQLLDLGRPAHSVRCSTVAPASTTDSNSLHLWVGYRNKIHVIDPYLLTVKGTIVAHVRRESQVRHMAVSGVGVWVSIRMESTLKLFHTITHQHLQDLNPETSIIQIIGQSCRINFLRITSLSCIGNLLWIGTNAGVVVTLPVGQQSQSTSILSNMPPSSSKSRQAKPGGIVRVFNHSSTTTSEADSATNQIALTSSTSSNDKSTTSSTHQNTAGGENVTTGSGSSNSTGPAGNCGVGQSNASKQTTAAAAAVMNVHVPYCSLSQMRLSFHAHRNDVKFFVGSSQRETESAQSSNNGGDNRGRRISTTGIPSHTTSNGIHANANSTSPTEKTLLHVLSGGRGYIDHRIGDKVEESEQNVPLVVSSVASNSKSSSVLGSSTLSSSSLSGTGGGGGFGGGSNLSTIKSSPAAYSKQIAKSYRSHIILWKHDISDCSSNS